MHIYLIKSRLNNEIIHIFGALDNFHAVHIMRFYNCLDSAFYLERISSYTTVEVDTDLDLFYEE